jgi:tetratricopeptide (TPR) repeat protein
MAQPHCLAAGLIILAASALAQPAAKPSLAQAAELLGQQKPKDAEAVLRRIVKAEPGNASAWNLLGAALDSQHACPEAEAAFQRAARLAPGAAAVWNNLGNHYTACGDSIQAGEAFRKVLALEPGHPNAHLQLARLAVERKDGAAALRHVDRLDAAQQADPALVLLRARALARVDRKAEALALLDGLERRAEGPQAWHALGLALAECGEFGRAEGLFSRALEADPANLDILHNLGVAALRAGHPQRGQDVLEAALRIRPEDPELLLQLGRALAAQNQCEDAIRVLAKARKLAPKEAEIVRLLAETSAQAGFSGDAALLFGEFLKLRPGDDNARLQRGLAYASARDKQNALQDLEGYVHRHPDDPEGHFGLAFALTLADPARAFEHFDRAIQLKPEYLQARLTRGAFFLHVGRPAEALPDLQYALGQRPDDLEVIDLLGRAYLSLDRPQDAAEVLQRGYEKAPHDPRILQHLGRAQFSLGKEAEGARLVEEFARLAPDRSIARRPAGRLRFLFLSPEELRAGYEEALRRLLVTRPADHALRAKLARLLLEEEKTDEALGQYRQILQGAAGAGVLVESAHALMQFHQHQFALPFLQRALVLEPSSETRLDLAIATSQASGPQPAIEELEKTPAAERKGDYYLLRGQLLDTLGRVKEAAESLNAALALAPARGDLYHSATLFLLKNRMAREADALLDRAIQNVPDDRDLQLLKAVILARASRLEESRLLLERMSRRWPEWSRPYLARGVVEQGQYRNEEALRSVQTALDLGENSPEAYFYLGLALHKASPEQWRRALDAAEQAIAMSPDDPWARILAGRISKEAGRYDAALRYLREATRMKPGLAQAHYWLGSTYLAMGKTAEGQQEMAQVDRLRDRDAAGVNSEDWGMREKLFALSQ